MLDIDNTLDLIWKGLLVGILASAPMGPVGVLCIQRTLNKGRWFGFVTGVGAAFSDIVYALLAGYAISFVIDLITKPDTLFYLQLIGSVLLMLFGAYTFRSDPTHSLRTTYKKRGSLLYNMFTGFLITFLNPLIILLFVALFARFPFVTPDSFLSQTLGYVAVFGGALLWWFLLTSGIDKVRNRFEVNSIRILNRIIGGVVILASVITFAGTLLGLSLN